uniref:Uncharacterized protein n=1 Tax=Arion vulgaris TaxID=1028688 RepID=A0A0B6ZYA7_9EUPU
MLHLSVSPLCSCDTSEQFANHFLLDCLLHRQYKSKYTGTTIQTFSNVWKKKFNSPNINSYKE